MNMMVKYGEKNRTYCPAASFTLEAAVVVPVTMILLAAVLYVSFLLHDHAVIPSVMEYAILDHDLDSAASFAGAEEQFLAERLILPAAISVNVQGNQKKMYAAARAQFSVPGIMLPGLFGDEIRSFAMQITVSNLRGRKALLPYKVLCDGIREQLGKGVQKK